MIEFALSYADRFNFAVFPVHGMRDGICTCRRVNCPNAGKHPATLHGYRDATRNPASIGQMFGPDHNIGAATGSPSGIFALDIDGPDGEAALSQREMEHGPLPCTLTSITARGRHLIFRYPDVPVRSRAYRNKIEVKGDGSAIVLPPSVHRTGLTYHFEDSSRRIADAPGWLVEIVKERPGERRACDIEWSVDQVKGMLALIDPDLPYADWITVGMALHAGGYDLSLFAEWSAQGDKFRGVREIEAKWRSFRRHGISMGTLVAEARNQGWRP